MQGSSFMKAPENIRLPAHRDSSRALLAQAESASDLLHGGFTYAREHKTKVLGVSERLLKEQGAVKADAIKQSRRVRSLATTAIRAYWPITRRRG